MSFAETGPGAGSGNVSGPDTGPDAGVGTAFQFGTDYVPRTGPALLHRGEMVIPADEAAAVRAGSGEITLSIGAINVSGAMNPRETADEIIEILERRLREPGRLRTAVRTVARSV